MSYLANADVFIKSITEQHNDTHNYPAYKVVIAISLLCSDVIFCFSVPVIMLYHSQFLAFYLRGQYNNAKFTLNIFITSTLEWRAAK